MQHDTEASPGRNNIVATPQRNDLGATTPGKNHTKNPSTEDEETAHLEATPQKNDAKLPSTKDEEIDDDRISAH